MGDCQFRRLQERSCQDAVRNWRAPKEYNLKVHGPYDPAVYYGPKDTPFGQVKVKELPGWLARRGKSPVAMGRACSRAYWRWCHKYVFPTRSGLAAPLQFMVGWSCL